MTASASSATRTCARVPWSATAAPGEYSGLLTWRRCSKSYIHVSPLLLQNCSLRTHTLWPGKGTAVKRCSDCWGWHFCGMRAYIISVGVFAGGTHACATRPACASARPPSGAWPSATLSHSWRTCTPLCANASQKVLQQPDQRLVHACGSRAPTVRGHPLGSDTRVRATLTGGCQMTGAGDRAVNMHLRT